MKTKSPLFLFALLLGLSLFSSCKNSADPEVIAGDQIVGLASPIRLGPATTTVNLEDFFLDTDRIDSVISVAPNAPLVRISDDKKTLSLTVPGGEDVDPVSTIEVWAGGVAYSLICQRSQKKPVTMEFDPKGATYESVKVAGSLNSWNPSNTQMDQVDGIWRIRLDLDPGAYQYQLVVDGEWMLDPNNPDSVDNNIGGFNSSLIVQGVDPASVPAITATDFRDQKVIVGSSLPQTRLVALWENHSLEVKAVEGGNNAFEIRVPRAAKNVGKSTIRVFSYNAMGAGNDLLIPLENGAPVMLAEQVTPDIPQAMIMYFMLVDRFNNGDPGNDAPLEDERVDAKANYQGGDLQGITQKIEEGFFEELGVNTLWISPINQNPTEAFQEWPEPRRWFSGYHGYWPVSSSKVDTRFGGNAAFKELVETAHANETKVLLDVVANHVHEQHPMILQHPEWKTELNLPDGTKNIRIWEEQRLTTWFDTFMPSLDYSKPEVIEAQMDSTLFWITEFGIDGYRHDATKHIPESFWRALTRELKTEVMVPGNRSLYQIGETFGSRELIGSYVGSGMVDGQFDFNLYFDARSVFAVDKESFKKLNSSLQETFNWYGYHHKMGNITGNHDIARFISYAGEAMVFNEDDKAAGWDREIEVQNPVGYDKLSMLHAFILTVPGIPIIYYGDEYGVAGAGDPDNRRFMEFSGYSPEEQATRDRCKQLIELRKKHLALIYGDFQVKHLEDLNYIYTRQHFNDHVIVAFNKSAEPVSINIDLDYEPGEQVLTPHFGGKGTKVASAVSIELPAYGFEVLTWE